MSLLCTSFIQSRPLLFFFFFQAEDGIRDVAVTGVQTCALPICRHAEALGLLHQGVDLIGPVEQTVLGVNVEVDELGRHAGFLMVSASLTRRLILATTSFEVNPRWRSCKR